MMRIGIACCLLAACAAGAIVLGLQTSQAQIAPSVTYEYAAKIVCNRPPQPTTGALLAPGTYFVAVNVHNPSAGPTTFKCKVALAGLAADATQIPQFSPRCKQIGPDRVQVFHCRFFTDLAPVPPGTFIDGYFVIISNKKLDVTAYYTSVGSTGQTPAIAVERIAERRLVNGEPE